MSELAVLDQVNSKLDDVLFLLSFQPVPETVGLGFVAKKYGVDVQYLRRRPWAQPAFGVSEVSGKLAWSIKTVREWTAVSLAEHEHQWFALSVQARAVITKKRDLE